MTDEVTTIAVIQNPNGHQLRVFRLQANIVAVYFALAKNSHFILDNTETPMYRVDKQKAVSLSALKHAFLLSAFFFVIHDSEQGRRSGQLAQIMNGDKLRLRYGVLGSDLSEHAVFDLTGAKEAILEALGHRPRR
jgi:hypothetical protein